MDFIRTLTPKKRIETKHRHYELINHLGTYGTLFFLLLLLSACVSKKKNDWQNLSLQGKVKQIVELQYRAVERFGKVEKGDFYREEGWDMVILFNEQGYFLNISYINASGEEVGSADYTYNTQNELIEEKNYDAEGNFSDKNIYSYDEKRRVNQVIGVNSDGGLTGSVLTEYDDKMNQQTISSYNVRGKLLRKELRTVNKKGFPLETKIYDAENNLINYRKERFNSNGLREKLIVYSSEGTVLMEVSFKYDKHENLLSQEGVDEKGEAFLPVRYEYLFDKQGNWTKRFEYVGDKPTFILERQIEYYDMVTSAPH